MGVGRGILRYPAHFTEVKYMSDQLNPNTLVNPASPDIATIKAELAQAQSILDNWDALEKTGAAKNLNKKQIEGVVTLTQQLVNLMENPPT